MATGSKRTSEKAFTEVGRNPQATEICNYWNEGRKQQRLNLSQSHTTTKE